jgi:hypothetical protein
MEEVVNNYASVARDKPYKGEGRGVNPFMAGDEFHRAKRPLILLVLYRFCWAGRRGFLRYKDQ